MKTLFEKIEGIVLRTQDYGETHKIVRMFTRERGKLGLIARGAKKPKSRMAAITQPFIHGSFLIQPGSGLGILQQGEVLSSLRSIREDIVQTAYATYLAELTDKLIDEKSPDLFLYGQLLQTYIWMAEGKDAEILAIIYELKMYRKAGFAPMLEHCVQCGNTSGNFSFSINEGGILCQRCVQTDSSAYHISEKLLQLMRLFSTIDVARIGNISIKQDNKQKLQQIMDAYYDQYGGYFLKSKKFLKQLDLLK